MVFAACRSLHMIIEWTRILLTLSGNVIVDNVEQ